MATDKMSRLNTLANQMPMIDEQAAARERGALDVMAASAAPQSRAGIQAMGGQVATQQGQIAQQSMANTQQNLSNLGQQQTQLMQSEGQAQLGNLQLAQNKTQQTQDINAKMFGQQSDIASRKQITQSEIDSANRVAGIGMEQDNRLNVLNIKERESIAALGGDVKQKLFDAQMIFEKDELGRKFSNERQLADYAKVKARDDIEFQSNMKEIAHAIDRDLIMTQAAYEKISQTLEQGYKDNKQKLDQAQMVALSKMKKDMEDDMRKKQAKAGMIKAVVTGGAMIGGAVITGGTPTGAMAGGAAAQAVLGGYEASGGTY